MPPRQIPGQADLHRDDVMAERDPVDVGPVASAQAAGLDQDEFGSIDQLDQPC